jgi:TP901 family phage tail tape measure protein
MSNDSTVTTALVLTAVDKASRVVSETMNKSIAALNRLKNHTETINKSVSGSGISVGKGIAGFAAYELAKNSIEAYENMEDAQNQLKMSFLKTGGAVDSMYDKMKATSENLAGKYTGGVAKMMEMTNILYQSGVKAQDIIDGVGDSTGMFAKVMKVDYSEAAAKIGRISTSLKLTGKDLTSFMDIMTKTKYMGIQNFDEIAMVMSKSRINLFGQTGIENAKATAAIMAQLTARIGDAGVAGQAFGQVMAKAMDPKNIRNLNAALPGKLAMQFTDSSGQFLGFRNMIGQLGKMKGLSDAQKTTILTKFFGGRRGFAAAAGMMNMGIEGFDKAQQSFKDQASMAERFAILSKEAGYKAQLAWDKLKLSLLRLGEILMPIMDGLVDMANKMITAWTNFSSKNKMLATSVKWVLIAVIGLRVAMIASSFVFGGAIRNIIALIGGISKAVKLVNGLSFAIQYYSLVVKQSAIYQRLATIAQWSFNTSLYGCPVVWIIAGVIAIIAAVALLVKYWKPITAFFSQIWEKIKGVFSKFSTWFKSWGKWVILPLMPFLAIPMLIINNWGKISAFFSNLFSGIRNIFNKVVSWFAGIGKMFYNAGKNIITSIWNGIKAMAMKPVEAITSMVKKMRNLLPFSPAKDGPFKDLHRIRIVETIAQSIRPAPALRAMRGVVDAMAGVGPSGRGRSSSGGLQLTYAPVINITGGNSTREDILTALKSNEADVIRWFNGVANRGKHLQY